MNRIIVSSIFVLFIILFTHFSVRQAHALPCGPFPLGALAAGCPCLFGQVCASDICIRVPSSSLPQVPLPYGVCAPESKPSTGGTGTIGTSPNLQPPPCNDLDQKTGKCKAVPSALGDFSTEPAPFITRIFGFMLAASGSIALLFIMRSGYKIMSARGNPEGIQQGREQLVSAIIGLMFIILSFVLLQVIAIDLLKIK